jgi:hypothetical protein
MNARTEEDLQADEIEYDKFCMRVLRIGFLAAILIVVGLTAIATRACS